MKNKSAMQLFQLIIVIVLAQLLFMLVPVRGDAQQGIVRISTLEEITHEFESVPCGNEERLNAVRALFERMGAPASDISVERYRNVENLIVRKQGTSPETIVIGAHYDKVSDGCGAIDNWTGIVAIAHLYRSLKDVPLRKTLIFVAFGKEERGLVGSRAMVEATPRDQLAQYCSMVNIDSLGLAAPQVADNISNRQLREIVATLANTMNIPFAHAAIEGDSDSTSFRRRQIPAITIHGLSNDFSSIIHLRSDQTSRVRPVSVYLGYRLALSLVTHLDESSCTAYR